MATMPRQLQYTPVSAASLLNVFAQGIDDLATAVYGSTTRTHVPSCLLHLTAYRNAATSTSIVNWDATVFDTDTMWSASTPSLITINTSGQWLVFLQLVYTSNATGHMWGFVTRNSTNIGTGSILSCGNSSLYQFTASAVVASLTAGDVLRCYTDNSAGVTQQLQNDFGETRFGLIWIGP